MADIRRLSRPLSGNPAPHPATGSPCARPTRACCGAGDARTAWNTFWQAARTELASELAPQLAPNLRHPQVSLTHHCGWHACVGRSDSPGIRVATLAPVESRRRAGLTSASARLVLSAPPTCPALNRSLGRGHTVRALRRAAEPCGCDRDVYDSMTGGPASCRLGLHHASNCAAVPTIGGVHVSVGGAFGHSRNARE